MPSTLSLDQIIDKAYLAYTAKYDFLVEKYKVNYIDQNFETAQKFLKRNELQVQQLQQQEKANKDSHDKLLQAIETIKKYLQKSKNAKSSAKADDLVKDEAIQLESEKKSISTDNRVLSFIRFIELVLDPQHTNDLNSMPNKAIAIANKLPIN